MRSIPVMVLLATVVVSAQTNPSVADGIAAFDRGDFAAAVLILKPLAYDVPSGPEFPNPDPLALAYLGEIFRRGETAPADWPLACALFHLSLQPPMQTPRPLRTEIPFAIDGIKNVCLPEQRAEFEVLRSVGLRDGITRQQMMFDDGTQVVVDRTGFHIDFHGEHRDVDVLRVMWREVVASITASAVSAVDERGRRTHFVEMFKWRNPPDPIDPHLVVRELHWVVFELRETHVQMVLDLPIFSVAGGPYPSTELPSGVRDLAILRPKGGSGEVEWVWRGAPPKRGTLPQR